jgi:hypothetical protein
VSKSLKSQNHAQLVLFVIANACAMSILLAGWDGFIAFAGQVLKGNWALIGRMLGISAVAGLLVGIAGWALPRKFKETLVFWRVGPRCLPSSRAFSEIAKSDPRIDVDQLRARVGEFPSTATQQSSRWYSIYRKHEKEPAVEDANRAYLLYRDMAALVPIMILVLTVLIRALHLSPPNWIPALGILLSEFVLLVLAARNAGSRLIANVLAIEGSLRTMTKPVAPSTGRRRKPESKA